MRAKKFRGFSRETLSSLLLRNKVARSPETADRSLMIVSPHLSRSASLLMVGQKPDRETLGGHFEEKADVGLVPRSIFLFN